MWLFQIFSIFTPNLGGWTQFDEHIFQMGWFNHQAVIQQSPYPTSMISKVWLGGSIVSWNFGWQFDQGHQNDQDFWPGKNDGGIQDIIKIWTNQKGDMDRLDRIYDPRYFYTCIYILICIYIYILIFNKVHHISPFISPWFKPPKSRKRRSVTTTRNGPILYGWAALRGEHHSDVPDPLGGCWSFRFRRA